MDLGDDLGPADVIETRSGETLAVAGVVVSESGELDESLMSGESRPRSVGAGDRVVAGAVNVGGTLRVTAEATGDETRIAKATAELNEMAAGMINEIGGAGDTLNRLEEMVLMLNYEMVL